MSGYERCVVTFLDILGFRSLLGRKSAEEIASDLVKFRKFTEGDEPHQPRRMKDYRLQSEVRAEIISDAIVRVRTTETQYQDGPFVWELLDLLHIQIDCIANGILIRGAMQIGDMHLGMSLEGPVFGQALVDAYLMEENDVVFPMIAVDQEVVRQHLKDERLWLEGHSARDEQDYADRLLAQDERGIWFIDYLRASLNEMDAYYHGWIEFLRMHRDLISRELNAGHPERVREKFDWLRDYHNRTVNKARRSFDVDEGIEEFGDRLENIFADLIVPE
ncbi:hypothetical protein GCM10011415_15390 [Salipiger pallidus]|uniref:Uncharacterized protein n=1 Tax=Salipiger pallidus TaxID=1775170 RepID=A0A8J2ZJ10_9RHOB|nr:hypothetical protein [Salipiger pallidus]GGG68992.1 hypothetical protein GCM10011415_15390 [Salipiger pallidus]